MHTGQYVTAFQILHKLQWFIDGEVTLIHKYVILLLILWKINIFIHYSDWFDTLGVYTDCESCWNNIHCFCKCFHLNNVCPYYFRKIFLIMNLYMKELEIIIQKTYRILLFILPGWNQRCSMDRCVSVWYNGYWHGTNYSIGMFCYRRTTVTKWIYNVIKRIINAINVP